MPPLTRPFDLEEVKEALFRMHRSKTSGLEDMNVNFFKKHIHLNGKDVAEYMISVIDGTQNIS